jgi:hypothetical protein
MNVASPRHRVVPRLFSNRTCAIIVDIRGFYPDTRSVPTRVGAFPNAASHALIPRERSAYLANPRFTAPERLDAGVHGVTPKHERMVVSHAAIQRFVAGTKTSRRKVA